jgi:hypothetical protein
MHHVAGVYACMREICAHAKMFHSFQHSDVCARTPSRAFMHRRRSAQRIFSHLSLSDIITGDSLCVFSPPHLPLPVHLFSSVVHLHLSRTHLQMHTISVTQMHQQIDAWKHMQLTHVQLYKSDRHDPGNSPSSPRQTFKMTGGNPCLLSCFPRMH